MDRPTGFDVNAALLAPQNGGVLLNARVGGETQVDGGLPQLHQVGCRIVGVDLYWVIFSNLYCVDTRFERCAFRGVSFPGCIFLNCTFVDCVFGLDNLGGSCDLATAIFIDCAVEGGSGFPVERSVATGRAP